MALIRTPQGRLFFVSDMTGSMAPTPSEASMSNPIEKTTFKFVAISNGERAAGIPASQIAVEISIDDDFEQFREEFVEDARKFLAPWMDGARVYTQEEFDKLSGEEHEGDDSVPSTYRHMPGAADICAKCERERWMHGTRHDTCTRFQSEE